MEQKEFNVAGIWSLGREEVRHEAGDIHRVWFLRVI